jgi:putative tryptophan/tyrosine transport system substrate-binding protein
LQLLRELMPNAALFGALVDPPVLGTPSIIADLQAAARTLGLQLVVANARTDSDLETAFATFLQHRVGAVLVGSSTFFNRNSRRWRPATHCPRYSRTGNTPWPVA